MHHVGSVEFGRGITPYTSNTPLRDVYMTETVTDDVTRRLMLLETYDITYEIFDHEHQDKPLAVLSLHPAEDVVTNSRLSNKVREVVSLRLPEITNTPLVELLSYPRYILDKLIEDAKRAKVREDATAQQLEAGLTKP